MLVADFGIDEVAGMLRGLSLGQPAKLPDGSRIDVTRLGRERKCLPFSLPPIPTRKDDRTLGRKAFEGGLCPSNPRSEALKTAK